MEYLNRHTKQAKAFIKAYNDSNIYTVCGAYKSPSQAKINAEKRIYERDARDEEQSTEYSYLSRVRYSSYKIIGHNCSCFTIARLMDVYGYGNEKGTIITSYLIVDTPTRTYQIRLHD